MTVLSGGPYSQAFTFHMVENCLPPARYAFTINDIWGDGICCSQGSGSYAVVVDGVTTLSGGSFGRSETKTFGSSCTVSPPSPVVACFLSSYILCVYSLILIIRHPHCAHNSPPLNQLRESLLQLLVPRRANLVRASQQRRSRQRRSQHLLLVPRRAILVRASQQRRSRQRRSQHLLLVPRRANLVRASQ
jgi:hypothetical protein